MRSRPVRCVRGGAGVFTPAFAAACLLEAVVFGSLVARPLFWAFHFELSFAANLALIALAGPFAVAGLWPGAGLFDPDGLGRAWIRAGVLAAIPLLAALFSQVLAGSCDTAGGLAWYGLLPGIGSLLVVSLAAVCSVAAARRRGAFLLYGLAVLAFLASFGWHLYFGIPYRLFNLLLGYWPGVLYDEYVPIEAPLLFARLEALLLAAALSCWALGAIRSKPRLLALGLTAACLFALSWAAESRFGVHPTRAGVERTLGLSFEGRHARWVAPAKSGPKQRELALLAARFDFQAERVAEVLPIAPLPPMTVYVFESPAQKRKIVGAENTVVTRPWGGELYLDAGSMAAGVLRHEAVHLIAAPWAYPGVGISPNIALLEGLAVSLGSSPSSAASPEGLSAAVLEQRPDFDLAQFLSGPGFWRLSPELAYPLAGAFVAWLKNQDLAEPLSALYRRGRPAAASMSELAARWMAYLKANAAPTAAERALARRVLSARPLQRKRCAHEVAECLHGEGGGYRWVGSRGTSDAIARALRLDPARQDVRFLRARAALQDGDSRPIEEILPGNFDAEEPPTSLELEAAGLWAQELAGRGDYAGAAQWFSFILRWSANLRGLWRAAQGQALGGAGGAEVSFQSLQGNWGLSCSLAPFSLGTPECQEARPVRPGDGPGGAAKPFGSPLLEFAAAFAGYEDALAGFDFEGAARWAARMEGAWGVPAFLTAQAREAREEALWLGQNFEFYAAKLIGAGGGK